MNCTFSVFDRLIDFGTTIHQLATDLAQHMDVVLDRRALQEIGLDDDIEVPSPRMKRKEPQGATGSSKPDRWWDEPLDRSSDSRQSVVCDVMLRIRELDLTLMIRHGQVVITTIESAEDEPATRSVIGVGSRSNP